jgi:hypothetical protein
MSTITHQITESFIQGARFGQADWSRIVNTPTNDATFILFGDGHGYWSTQEVDLVADLFRESLEKLPQDEAYDASDILLHCYQYAANHFITQKQNFDGGSSIICCFVTETEFVALSCGDSEILVEHHGEKHYIEPFDWDSPNGIKILNKISAITDKQFLGLKKRPDSLQWEDRKLPEFRTTKFSSSIYCLPETIGFLGSGEVFDSQRFSVEQKTKLCQLCAGVFPEEGFTREDLFTIVGPTEGIKITMASDGIRSKGCLPLNRTIEHYATLLENPNLTPGLFLTLSPDSILQHFLGPIVPGQNPMKLNMLRENGAPHGDPKGLLSSHTRFLQEMAAPNSLQIIKSAYDMWLPCVADQTWRDAINEQLEYFTHTPTLQDAQNPLEFVNRCAVLNLSDDNVSSVQITIGNFSENSSLSNPDYNQTRALIRAKIILNQSK